MDALPARLRLNGDRVRWIASLCVLAACARTADAPRADATSTSTPLTGPWLGFAAYPDAHEVCNQHVAGSTMHISWQMYATTDPVDRVRDFYERTHPDFLKGDELRRGDDDIVAFHPKTPPSYPTCDRQPAAADQTVFIVSHASR